MDLMGDLANYLKTKGYKNVNCFVNVECDRVITFDSNGYKLLLTIDVL